MVIDAMGKNKKGGVWHLMASYNQITLIGRVGKDPELRYTQSTPAAAVTSFSLAVPRYAKQGDPEKTDWFNIVAWKDKAEGIANYVNKGDLLLIVGSVSIRNWTDSQQQKRTSVEVLVDRYQRLTPKQQSSGSAGTAPQASSSPAAASASQQQASTGDPDYDPFVEE